jgi:hypothetical protein
MMGKKTHIYDNRSGCIVYNEPDFVQCAIKDNECIENIKQYHHTDMMTSRHTVLNKKAEELRKEDLLYLTSHEKNNNFLLQLSKHGYDTLQNIWKSATQYREGNHAMNEKDAQHSSFTG